MTFDYQWPVSQRPPTVCYCGSATCRGFLEVNTTNTMKTPKNKDNNNNNNNISNSNNNNSNNYNNDDDNYDSNNNGFRRKGLWKSKNEFFEIMIENNDKNDLKGGEIAEMIKEDKMKMEVDGDEIETKNEVIIKDEDDNAKVNQNQKEDENSNAMKVMKIDPCSLVGKYVKVWWQSNLRFFEADVKEYSLKTGDGMNCLFQFNFLANLFTFRFPSNHPPTLSFAYSIALYYLPLQPSSHPLLRLFHRSLLS